MVLDLERKSRLILGILAIVAILVFFLTTLGISQAATIGTAIIGILISILILAEVGIVGYISRKGYKTINFSDIMVWVGAIAAGAMFVFSISLVPMIGEILPTAITNFTTTFAKIIAGISLVVVGVLAFTPRFR